MSDITLISGAGRSGTMSCAYHFKGLHEPRPSDFNNVYDAFKDDQVAEEYAHGVIVPFIENCSKPYVEVNSLLCYYIDHLDKMLPEAKIYHLVRNEKDVISSIMKRDNYTERGLPRQNKEPEGGFPKSYTRRQKITWMVRDMKRRMDKYPVINIEELTDMKLNQS